MSRRPRASPDGEWGGTWSISPVWLVGQAFAVGVFVLSGVALYFGELAVVQPLLVMELIFSLALREFRLHDVIPVKSWYAAGLVCLGLGAFLGVANFHGGTRVPKAVEWAVALSVWSFVAAVLVVVGQRGSLARRAGCIGAAAAVVWSVDTGFVKKLTDTLHEYGFLGVFDHWPLYALVVSGILGLRRRPPAVAHVGQRIPGEAVIPSESWTVAPAVTSTASARSGPGVEASMPQPPGDASHRSGSGKIYRPLPTRRSVA